MTRRLGEKDFFFVSPHLPISLSPYPPNSPAPCQMILVSWSPDTLPPGILMSWYTLSLSPHAFTQVKTCGYNYLIIPHIVTFNSLIFLMSRGMGCVLIHSPFLTRACLSCIVNSPVAHPPSNSPLKGEEDDDFRLPGQGHDDFSSLKGEEH